MHRDDRDEKIASSCISRPGPAPARHVATKNACTHADLIAQPLHACGGSWFELVKATMDAEPPAKRPCLTQTTLFGQVVVADADIYSKPANEYERFVNAFVRRERRVRGKYTYTLQNRASYKHAADVAWRTASSAEKQKLIEEELPSASTSRDSSTKVADYGF